jgi:hypothetical protein
MDSVHKIAIMQYKHFAEDDIWLPRSPITEKTVIEINSIELPYFISVGGIESYKNDLNANISFQGN